LDQIINRTNFFKNIKLTPEGYVEMLIVPYLAPQEGGIDQYKTFLILKLDSEGRLVITQKPSD
jgi:hypothetical protein